MKLKKITIYLVVMFFLFQESINRWVNIGIIGNLDEILIAILLLYFLLNIVKNKKIKKNIYLIVCFTILFSLFGILSCYLNSEFILSRVIISNFLAIKFFVMIFSLSIFNFKTSTKNYIISALKFWCKISMIVGGFNFIAPKLYSKIFTFAMVTYRFGFVSITSLFYHTGRFGWFMLFMAILYYVEYVNYKSNVNKKMMIICIIFSILSFRTKVIMSLVVLIAFEIILNGKISLKKLLIGLFILLIIGLSFSEVIINTYNLYFTNTITVSARKALTDMGFKILVDYFPLGVGFGKYGSYYASLYYSEYYYKYNLTNIFGLSPSNPVFGTDVFWPSIIGEVGFIGLLIYVFLLYYIYKNLKLNIISKDKYKKIFSYWGMLALIQSICESIGEPSFNSPPQNLFLALIIGIGFMNEKNKKNERIE